MNENKPGALVRIEPSPLEQSQVPQSDAVTRSPQEFRAAEIDALMMQAYLKAGTLTMTPEEQAKLTAPFPRSAIELREKKFNYIPHIQISRRLTEVFGPGQWTMIRRREWIVGNQINAEWVMIVRGHFIGESIGSQEYYPNNARSNFADVLEATRGECIRRIAGKYLSCGGEAWDPQVARELDAERTRAALRGKDQSQGGPQRSSTPAVDAGNTGAATITAVPDSLRSLKARLWALMQPVHLCQAGDSKEVVEAGRQRVAQTLWDEGFVADTEVLSELNESRLRDVIAKVEAKMKGEQ